MKLGAVMLALTLGSTSCGLIGSHADADPASLMARCLQVPAAAVIVNVGDDGLAEIQFLVDRLGGRHLTEDQVDKCIDDSGLEVR